MLDSSPRSNSLPPGILAGDIVASRYRLEEVIGRGGMGVVVAARHLELDERVAVKFMSPEALSDPEAIARFDREVKAAARIKSEYVARVYDAGKLPDGRRYMVLEYLEGEDLSARIQREGPLEPEQAVRFLLQASSAVLEAHALGIIHRDLKPANLRVVRRADGSEIIKVLDFGIMKRMPGAKNETGAHDTKPGTIVGTPFYTSPEQLRGSAHVDARSDVWSMGATLFELLTGAPPFGGKTYPQVIANVLESTPIALRELRPDLPKALEAVVKRCLEKLPDARYDGIIDLAMDLAETIDLDSELRGLLERMLRHQRSSPVHTPVSLDTPRRSEAIGHATPAFAVVPSDSRGKRVVPWVGTSAKQYQAVAHPRRRLLLTSVAALLSALLVIAIGLPWLPDFGRRVPLAAGLSPPAAPPLAEPAMTALAAPEPAATAHAAPNQPTAASGPVSPPLVASAKLLRTRPQPSHEPKSIPTAATFSSPPAAASAKNPLLVRPR